MSLKNETPTLRDLLPDLLGGFANDPVMRQDPARTATAWIRPVLVSSSAQSTYVVPGDWPGKPEHWFADDAPTYKWRHQNNVEYFIDGEATFDAMAEALDTATSSDHFVILLGWTLHLNFALSKAGHRSRSSAQSLYDIFKACVARGATLRVLLFPNIGGEGLPVLGSTRIINGPAPITSSPADMKALCILDGAHRGVQGSHHQKVLIVYGSNGLIGFFGGVDFNPDRVDATAADGAPYHDVHARVVGEAADDLLVLAVNRWNFSEPLNEDAVKPGGDRYKTGREMDDLTRLLDRARASRCAPPSPHHVVKIGQTVGNPELARMQENGVWPIVRHAIRAAKKFIYIEDQYLWSVHAAQELGNAAGRLAHITILIPPDDMVPSDAHRHRALRAMRDAAGAFVDRIRIYVIREQVHKYIHAKMFVFDDEYAIIGSANCNNRGYFFDSEINAGIADLDWEAATSPWVGRWWKLELGLAHKLRIQLWQEHLAVRPEWLIDGVGAEIHWRSLEAAARTTRYLIEGKLWHEADVDTDPCLDQLIDPDLPAEG